LSAYVVGSVAGLTVLPPHVAEPPMAATDAEGPQPARPGTASPYVVRLSRAASRWASVSQPSESEPARCELLPVASLPCPGQETLDLRAGS
jgi:hypothetical protein